MALLLVNLSKVISKPSNKRQSVSRSGHDNAGALWTEDYMIVGTATSSPSNGISSQIQNSKTPNTIIIYRKNFTHDLCGMVWRFTKPKGGI
ncbi:hypothetical protein GLOIN_2v1877698 [Rhizophagus irregularis DAOM 181602=DAOM 197198]|nr:hypothetical protein GLOIN_2v1877698 [Rhizophagus irregularis DAOM 181602=DAOM 197198]CAG8543225.1 2199_t:CDS:2 [Rhizophagus irregularis]